MASKITCVQEVKVYDEQDNPWLRLYFDRVEFSDGRAGRYNRIVESGGRPGVAVLPICRDTIGLVRQYRYPLGMEMWEIPRGFGVGPSVEDDARRELAEETGVQPTDLISLGIVHPNSGILSSAVHVFAAVFPAPPAVSSQTDDEVAEFRWFPYSEVCAMIRTGEITDGFTLAAVLQAVVRRLVPAV